MNIKKIFSKKPKTSLQDTMKRFSRLSNDPYLDWIVVVIVWFIAFIVFAFMGYRVCRQVTVRINSAVIETPTMTIKTFDEKKLDSVLQEYDSRRAEWYRLKEGSFPLPSDPSV